MVPSCRHLIYSARSVTRSVPTVIALMLGSSNLHSRYFDYATPPHPLSYSMHYPGAVTPCPAYCFRWLACNVLSHCIPPITLPIAPRWFSHANLSQCCTNLLRIYVQLTNLSLSFYEQLAHIKHMNHGSQFQQLWSMLRSEVLALQQRGYYGDGAFDTCGSSVRRTFLSVMPFPTIPRPLYTPTFLISDTSGCVTLAWSYFEFQNCSHCLTESDGLHRLTVGYYHATCLAHLGTGAL